MVNYLYLTLVLTAGWVVYSAFRLAPVFAGEASACGVFVFVEVLVLVAVPFVGSLINEWLHLGA
jgi:hypothetical protein